MDAKNENWEDFVIHDPEYRCPVCGATQYITDHGNHELTLHCSSEAARFWEYTRGSADEGTAKAHWDRSRRDVFMSVEDIFKYMLLNEAVPTEAQRKKP